MTEPHRDQPRRRPWLNGRGFAVFCIGCSVFALWIAVVEWHLGWVVTSFLWLGFAVDSLDEASWLEKVARVGLTRHGAPDEGLPSPLAPPRSLWRLLSSGLPPHLPCNNPQCSIFAHYPPVCDFCWSTPVTWEYRAAAAVWWMVGEAGFFLIVIGLLSQVSTAAPVVLAGSFFIVLAFPVRWWRGKVLVLARVFTWGWGRFVWQACDECHRLIEAGGPQAVAVRAEPFVPLRLGLAPPAGTVSSEVVSRQQKFFSHSEKRVKARAL